MAEIRSQSLLGVEIRELGGWSCVMKVRSRWGQIIDFMSKKHVSLELSYIINICLLVFHTECCIMHTDLRDVGDEVELHIGIKLYYCVCTDLNRM